MNQVQVQIYNKRKESGMARIGDLFFISLPIPSNNSNEIDGFLPIISLLTAIRQEDGKMWFFTLAADVSGYSISKVDKNSITLVRRDGKERTFTKEVLVQILLDKFYNKYDTNLIVKRVPIYTTRIIMLRSRMPKANFIHLEHRMVDVSLWPIQAIDMWSRYQLRMDVSMMPKVLKDIEMRIETVQDIVRKHVDVELARRQRKEKKKAPTVRPGDRIFTSDNVRYLNISEQEIHGGEILFQGPITMEQVPYYTVIAIDGTSSYIIVRPEDQATAVLTLYFTDSTVSCRVVDFSPREYTAAKKRKRALLAAGHGNKLYMQIEDNPDSLGVATQQNHVDPSFGIDHGGRIIGTTPPGTGNVVIGYTAGQSNNNLSIGQLGYRALEQPADSPPLEQAVDSPPLIRGETVDIRTDFGNYTNVLHSTTPEEETDRGRVEQVMATPRQEVQDRLSAETHEENFSASEQARLATARQLRGEPVDEQQTVQEEEPEEPNAE